MKTGKKQACFPYKSIKKMHFKMHKLHTSGSHLVMSVYLGFIPHGKPLWVYEFLTQMNPETFYRDFFNKHLMCLNT